MSSCSKLVYFYNGTHFFLDGALIFLSYVFELFVGSRVDNYPFCDIWHSMLFPEMVFLPVVMALIPVEMTFLPAVIMFAPTEVTLFAHGGDFPAENDFISKITLLMTSLQQPQHFSSITHIDNNVILRIIHLFYGGLFFSPVLVFPVVFQYVVLQFDSISGDTCRTLNAMKVYAICPF